MIEHAARLVAVLALSSWLAVVIAAISVTDDVGQTIVLPRPSERIVSLAPHATELLFAAGAGSHVIATSEYSDFPPAARAIPRIGGSSGFDLERIVALKPDVVIGWTSGNPRRAIERLQSLGLHVYLTEPRHLADIARNLEQLGRLAGTEAVAHEAAQRFANGYRSLAERYAKRPKVRVFYQVLDPVLMTVNGEHLISEVIRMCGGENVFAALPVLAPVVGEEAVLGADPDAIVAGGTEEGWRTWEPRWRAHGHLKAVKRGALYFIPADELHRSTPRVLQGAERLCAALDDARRSR